MDVLDRRILEILQTNGRISWRELGDEIGLSAPATADRVRQLERSGVITGYGARIDPDQIGLPIEAIIRLSSVGRDSIVDVIARELPEILECKRVTGTDSHVIRVLVRSTSHLEELLQPFWDEDTATITNIVTSTPVPRRAIPISVP